MTATTTKAIIIAKLDTQTDPSQIGLRCGRGVEFDIVLTPEEEQPG